MNPRPVLYTFRRCPYAMRARLAIASAGIEVELREVVLRDKPPSMLKASPKGTVPVLALPDGTVIDESIDIMIWALRQSDPDGWLSPWLHQHDDVDRLIRQNDGPFKKSLDRYKYPVRYADENIDPDEQRALALDILREWEARLSREGWLFASRPTLADMAVFPFIRQFAKVDEDWFGQAGLPLLQARLEDFLHSEVFNAVMAKYTPWKEGETGKYCDFKIVSGKSG